jgi:hypothetical protein
MAMAQEESGTLSILLSPWQRSRLQLPGGRSVSVPKGSLFPLVVVSHRFRHPIAFSPVFVALLHTMADPQQRNQSTARAFGEHTFTHTSNTGGQASSVAFSSSTGTGAPHWETSTTQGQAEDNLPRTAVLYIGMQTCTLYEAPQGRQCKQAFVQLR